MEIRWMVLAMRSRMNKTGSLDMADVFENYRTPGPPYHLSFQILSKIAPDPMMAGQKLRLKLRIVSWDNRVVLDEEFDYSYPSLQEVLGGWTPFHRFTIQDLVLVQVGEYTIEFLEGGKILASEGFKLIDSQEESDADFQGIQR